MSRRTDSGLTGLLVVDKPPGWTSHDVVARCRKVYGQRRAGHSGTLDPDATGVLLVGFGRLTRILRFLTHLPKRYVGEAVLGTATSTLDASGEVLATWDMGTVELTDVRAAAARLTGEIEQVPPMVSAVQVGGRRLHELAREGVEVEREPRRVTVYEFNVGPTSEAEVFTVEVLCSSGTYIRSLVADLGTALGGGAHLRGLRRTAIGSFTVDQAVPLDTITADTPLLGGADALRDYAIVRAAGPELVDAVRHGRVLSAAALLGDGPAGQGPWAVVDDGGSLLAVYERHRGDTVKPAVVVAAAAS